MNNLPKLVITDIDGVWTDGGMYYDNFDNEFKKFNTSDSAGVLFLKLLNIPTVIITGENSNIVKRRADKLQIKHCYLGVKNKLQLVENLLLDFNLTWSEIAFIGDDINDLKVLEKVGFSSAPENAPVYIKNAVNYVTHKKGGEGAFRDFVEKILHENDLLEHVLKLYFESLDSFSQ